MCTHVRWCLSSVFNFCCSWNAKLGATKPDAVFLSGHAYGNHLFPTLAPYWRSLCLTDSVCRATTLKDKVWWKDLYVLDLISSGFCRSVAPFPLCVPSRWMCLCLTFCLVLSALPVLACCVSPCFWLVKFGGQREVGFFVGFCCCCLCFLGGFFLLILLPSLMASPLG